MARAAAPISCRRIHAPDLARRRGSGRRRRHARRQHALAETLPAARRSRRWKTSSPQRFGVVRAADGSGAAAGRVRSRQARRRRAEFLLRRRPRLRLSDSDGESDGARSLAAEDYFARLGQQLAQLLDEATADGFSASRRPAPAAVRQRRARRVVVRGDGAVLPARRPRLGALRVAEGAARGRRLAAGERFLDDVAAVRLPPLPRLRRARRPARDEGRDRGRSRAQGTGRRHQARARRHPRNRIPRAGAAVDPRRPRADVARTSTVAGARRRSSNRAMSRAPRATHCAMPIASCAGWRTACRCCATRRRTCCRPSDVDRARIARGLGFDDWCGVA